MLRLVVLAALLGAAAPRLVYEPQADFYGADEITVEVTTDADGANASTIVPVVVAPIDDAATLLVSGVVEAEAGGVAVKLPLQRDDGRRASVAPLLRRRAESVSERFGTETSGGGGAGAR